MIARENIPERSSLIRQIEAANRIAWPWVLLQLGLCVFLIWRIDWGQALNSPLFSLLAVAVIAGPHFMEILRHYVTKKKEIDDLREQTRFGPFDKHQLRKLVIDTLNRLHLPLPGPPVYITADKTLNAGALHLGMGGFFRSLNGVYLHRQVLHRLTPEEVQDIIGHELGHFYRYYLVSQRFRGLTLLLGALSGLLVTQWIGMSSMISLVALSFCGTVFWIVAGRLDAKNGAAIEFLCDDLGAQVHSVVVSINGLLKVGADSEMQAAVHQQELLNRRHKNLAPRDILEAIEAAIPYGHTSREDLEQAVADSLKRRSEDRRNLSIGEFLRFAWQGEGESDELDDAMHKVRALQSVPRLDWESLLDRPGHIALKERQIETLVDMLEAHPEQVLFRLPEELGLADGVHPPTRTRILYLWKNRREIEANRSGTRR